MEVTSAVDLARLDVGVRLLWGEVVGALSRRDFIGGFHGLIVRLFRCGVHASVSSCESAKRPTKPESPTPAAGIEAKSTSASRASVRPGLDGVKLGAAVDVVIRHGLRCFRDIGGGV